MGSEDGEPLKLLEQERDRLERMLEGDDAWRALRQLEAREAEGRPVAAVDAAGLRTKIETVLEGNRVFLARRKISEAITLLGQPAPPVPAAAAPRPERVITIADVTSRRGSEAALPQSAQADDLTRIRGIDRALAAELVAAGVRRYAEIAAWGSADVRRITDALSLGRRIARENWIEQAALLAQPKAIVSAVSGPGPDSPATVAAVAPAPAPASETSFAASSVSSLDAVRPSHTVAELVAAAVHRILARASPPSLPAGIASPPASEPAAPLPPQLDDFMRIVGLGPDAAAWLPAAGIDTYGALSRLNAAQAAHVRATFGRSVGQWIEQAAILAAGGSTHHLRVRRDLASVPLAPPPVATETAVNADLAAHLSNRAAAAERDVAVEAALPLDEPPLTGLLAPHALRQPSPRPLLQVVVLPPSPLAEAAPPATPQPEAAVPPHTPSPPAALALPVLDLIRPLAASVDAGGNETGAYYDTLELSFSEAAVEIVSRPPDDDVATAVPEWRPFLSCGPGTLQSRLRKAGTDDEFDGSRYAAYRGAVEEASVEIVHRGTNPASGPAAPQAQPRPEAADGAEHGATGVRRFLKALTGQSG